VFWEQTPVQATLAAELQAGEISGKAMRVLPTGSMRPFIDDNDYIVVDTHFDWNKLQPGQPIVYNATWSAVPIAHRTAAKSGDNWIVSGDANRNYERGDLSISSTQFIGKIVAVYTTRQNPNK
jgi:signal peptidase I